MTYFGFLGLFVGIPIVLLLLSLRLSKKPQPAGWNAFPPAVAIAVLVVIAVSWTTPWDNYLVATRVWWYDPNLVTGITLGWVPIEEYTFFVAQTVFTGLWVVFLLRNGVVSGGGFRPKFTLNRTVTLILAVLWVAMAAILISGWQPGTYLALELTWALLPIMLQTIYGADLLQHNLRLVLLGIAPTTLYLSFADALAIQSGTWTINPEQSLDVLLFGVLPVEEFIFFLITNTLVVFGLTLTLSTVSRARFEAIVARTRGMVTNP